MAVDINKDTAVAIANLWKSHNGTGDILGLCGELKETLPSPEDAASGQPIQLRPPQTCYAQIVVRKGKLGQRQTGGVYNDYRDVELIVRGPEDQVQIAMGLVLAVFDLKHLMPVDQVAAFPGSETLTYPSGARFLRWWPMNDGEREPEKERKGGAQVMRGTVKGEIWSIRTDAGTSSAGGGGGGGGGGTGGTGVTGIFGTG